MSDQGALTGGRLRAGITNAITRMMGEFYGRGAERAKTYIFGDYVFVVLEDVLTTAERTLKQEGDIELIRTVRLTFEDLMTRALVKAVEQLAGRRVVAYHSQVVFDPDVAFEFFVLEPDGAVASGEGGVDDPAALGPGEAGDADSLPSSPRPGEGAGHSHAGSGATRAAISNAIVRLLREHHGKGPTSSDTFLADDYVFCIAREPLTTVERTLAEGDQHNLIRQARLRLLDLTADAYKSEVGALLNREVSACHGQIVFEPTVLFIVFSLVPQGGDAGSRLDEPDVTAHTSS